MIQVESIKKTFEELKQNQDDEDSIQSIDIYISICDNIIQKRTAKSPKIIEKLNDAIQVLKSSN